MPPTTHSSGTATSCLQPTQRSIRARAPQHHQHHTTYRTCLAHSLPPYREPLPKDYATYLLPKHPLVRTVFLPTQHLPPYHRPPLPCNVLLATVHCSTTTSSQTTYLSHHLPPTDQLPAPLPTTFFQPRTTSCALDPEAITDQLLPRTNYSYVLCPPPPYLPRSTSSHLPAATTCGPPTASSVDCLPTC